MKGGECILSGKEKQEGKGHAEVDLAGGAQFPQLEKALSSPISPSVFKVQCLSYRKERPPCRVLVSFTATKTPMRSRSPAAVTCLSLENGQVSEKKRGKDSHQVPGGQMATPGKTAPAPDLCAEVEAMAQKGICSVEGAGRGVLVRH